MIEFKPPRELAVYGEALQGTSLEAYLQLMETLGGLGLRVSVPEMAASDLAVPSEEVAQEFFDSLRMTNRDDIERFAQSNDFHQRTLDIGWRAIAEASQHFPMTPQGMVSSTHNLFVNPTPNFYYSGDSLTPTLRAVAHGRSIDLERGTSLDNIYAMAVVQYPAFNRDIVFDPDCKAFCDAAQDAELDAGSLGMYVDSDRLESTAGVGPKTVALFRGFCEEVLAGFDDNPGIDNWYIEEYAHNLSVHRRLGAE
jgi:hypothetical protein